MTAYWRRLLAAGGKMNLRGASIGGQFSLTAATVQGEIDLLGAHIGGQLSLMDATLTNPSGVTLNGNRLTVDQSLHCRGDFSANGEVHLVNAHIGGELDLTGAVSNPKGTALNGAGLTVEQNMFCHEEATIEGEVILTGAHISEHLGIVGATLRSPNPKGVALHLQNARIGTLLLHPALRPSAINLTHAQLGVLDDDPATWPDRLQLRGCTYDALYERTRVSAGQRMEWLCRDPDGYAPQPYEQLTAVYRRAGREEDAREIAIAKQRARRRTLPMPGRAGSLLLDVLVNYGYRPWLAGLWLLGLVRAGWWVFDLAHPAHLIATKPPGERPAFHAGLYALDLLLPIGDLSYQGAWIAQGWARWCWLAWILAGWVLTIAVLAALSGILKRD